MASKLSPESWVAWYIKSATNGRTLSVRLRRVLALVFIPLWIAIIVLSVRDIVDAYKARLQYNEIVPQIERLQIRHQQTSEKYEKVSEELQSFSTFIERDDNGKKRVKEIKPGKGPTPFQKMGAKRIQGPEVYVVEGQSLTVAQYITLRIYQEQNLSSDLKLIGEQLNYWRSLRSDVEKKIGEFYTIILYILCFIIAPWLISRVVFWIIDADNPKPSHGPFDRSNPNK